MLVLIVRVTPSLHPMVQAAAMAQQGFKVQDIPANPLRNQVNQQVTAGAPRLRSTGLPIPPDTGINQSKLMMTIEKNPPVLKHTAGPPRSDLTVDQMLAYREDQVAKKPTEV
jgi:hypothetical protein